MILLKRCAFSVYRHATKISWESFRCFALCLAGSVALVGLAAAKEPAQVAPSLKFEEPLPSVKAVAQRERIDLVGVDKPVDRKNLLPGDSITALISLTKGDDFSQWLVLVTCVEMNNADRKRAVKKEAKEMRFYTSLGTEIVFRDKREALTIRILGPYRKVGNFDEPAGLIASGKVATDVTARLTINGEFLGFGFNQACESTLHIQETMQKQPELRRFKWKLGTKPFPEAVVKEASECAKALDITNDRERAIVGVHPALEEFWRLASRTPGLQEIVRSVSDLPWWSIILKGGDVKAKLKPELKASYQVRPENASSGQSAIWGFPFALEVNGKAALLCHLIATNPRPPMLTAAGIIGLAARSPDGKGPLLMFQVCAAHLQQSERDSDIKGTAAVNGAGD